MADYKNDREQKIKDLTTKLEQGIKDVYESDNYKNFLSVMAKFHNYSFRNSMLIWFQNPEATHVAGFNAWREKFKRSVNKGEHGIQILAPAPYKKLVDRDKSDLVTKAPVIGANGKPVRETVEVIVPAFKPVYVFDVSQTSGDPLPQLVAELTGDVVNYNVFFDSIKDVSPYPIEFEQIEGSAKGYCDLTEKRIAIRQGMNEAQTIKTAIHEITHADLHAESDPKEGKDRRTQEVEAESTAFVVCNHYGIDTSDYSFGYIAGWSSTKELNELKSSLDSIQRQAAELIDRIDIRFQELIKDQDRKINIMSDKEEKTSTKKESVKVRMNAAQNKAQQQNSLSAVQKEKTVKLQHEAR